MSEELQPLRLPLYNDFEESLSSLSLPISVSELHGLMCGYLCAGEVNQGEAYLRALLGSKKDEESRRAAMSLFSLFSISQQQMNQFDFSFELLLPEDNLPLIDRAQAFSEWCEGFIQGLNVSGVGLDEFTEEEAQEAFQHVMEFAELEVDSLDVDEEDEKALVEVSEYTRMAVLRLHGDLMNHVLPDGGSKTTH